MEAVVCAAKPWTGSSFTMFFPSVRMMRQPPVLTPAAMVSAQTTLTQVAMSKFGVRRNSNHEGSSAKATLLVVARKRVSAMIPIVFWASFRPCSKAIQEELRICRNRKPPLAWRVFTRLERLSALRKT